MAGKTVVNQVQLGDSSTATQNFVLQTNDDGTAKLALGNAGETSQDVMTIGGTGEVDFPQMARSFGSSGHCKLPGGLIMQWGTGALTGGTNTVTFPVAFPNVCLQAVTTTLTSSRLQLPTALAAANFTVSSQDATASSGQPSSFRWFAVGY